MWILSGYAHLMVSCQRITEMSHLQSGNLAYLDELSLVIICSSFFSPVGRHLLITYKCSVGCTSTESNIRLLYILLWNSSPTIIESMWWSLSLQRMLCLCVGGHMRTGMPDHSMIVTHKSCLLSAVSSHMCNDISNAM